MAQEKIVQTAGKNASNEWLELVTDEEYGKINMNSMQSNHKILVAYFSATGVTAQAAQTVADATGGEVYAITPAKPYTDADLDRSVCSIVLTRKPSALGLTDWDIEPG